MSLLDDTWIIVLVGMHSGSITDIKNYESEGNFERYWDEHVEKRGNRRFIYGFRFEGSYDDGDENYELIRRHEPDM